VENIPEISYSIERVIIIKESSNLGSEGKKTKPIQLKPTASETGVRKLKSWKA